MQPTPADPTSSGAAARSKATTHSVADPTRNRIKLTATAETAPLCAGTRFHRIRPDLPSPLVSALFRQLFSSRRKEISIFGDRFDVFGHNLPPILCIAEPFKIATHGKPEGVAPTDIPLLKRLLSVVIIELVE